MKKSLCVLLSVLVAALMLFAAAVAVPSGAITEDAMEKYEEAAFGEE